MWIHTFGAYFGLSLSLALRRSKDIDAKNEGSSYNSDIFAMIGEPDVLCIRFTSQKECQRVILS